MEPAIPLVLTGREHVLIGELVDIIGQADDIMIETAKCLDSSAVPLIRAALNIHVKRAIWERVILSRVNDSAMAELLTIAKKKIEDTGEIRNDFIHVVFTGDYVEPGYVEPGYQTTSATRFKTGRTRPTGELQDARDRAAALSCLVAHIDARAAAGAGRGSSRWLRKIVPMIRAHRGPRTITRRASAATV